jgi:hypothetical protein
MSETTSATFVELNMDATTHPEDNRPSKWGVKDVSCVAHIQNLQKSRGKSDCPFGDSRSRKEGNSVEVVLLEL